MLFKLFVANVIIFYNNVNANRTKEKSNRTKI